MTLASPLRMRLQATVASVIGLGLWLWFHGVGPAIFAGMLGALALLAWVSPVRYAPLQHGLDAFGRWVAKGFSWFMLGLIYFGLFTPVRWLGVLLGRDSLKLKTRAGGMSYLDPSPPPSADRFKRQF